MFLCLGCMEEYNEKYDKCPYCDYVRDTPAVEAYHLTPGTILQGKYIVGRVLGFGGFGVTYIGKDALLEKKVAIKEYLPGDFSTRIPGQTNLTVFADEKGEQFEQGVHKFVDEAKRLAKFQNQEHIVEIYDTFMENQTAYIVMEYLEGETLKEKLEQDGKMEVEAALKIILPLAAALDEVHQAGIIHRDISPDNIFITRDGKIKLLDFGAARSATVGHSKSLSVIVKPGYAPTEQYRSKGEQGPWTDVYALAATLYRMITGEVPIESMERAGKDTLKLPSKLGVKISKGMENAIMNAMQISLKNRTQTMEQFIHELQMESTKRRRFKNKKADIGKWTIPMKLGVGFAGAALLTLAVLLATGVIGNIGVLSGNRELSYQTIPDLTGMNYNQAVIMLDDMGVAMRQAAYSYSDTMAENLIVTQSITEGTKVEEGLTMEVMVSLGKERRIIGDVEGFQLESVKDKLNGFYYSKNEVESELAPGAIVSIQDEQGEVIDVNSEIGVGNTLMIEISKGRSYDTAVQITVPDITGIDFADAREQIKESSLYIQKTELQSSETVPKGAVISQDIKAESSVTAGTVISVVVSSGVAPTVIIPNVLDITEEEAREMLENQKLTVKVSYEESNLVEAGKVIRSTPQVNEEVKEGSEVEIVVSSGNGSQRTTQSQSTERKNTTQAVKATQEKKSTEAKTTEKKSTEKSTTQATTQAAEDIEVEDDGRVDVEY